MSYVDGIISAPVRFSDVQQALGGYSCTDLGTLFSMSTINKWAKFKPFRLANISVIPVLNSSGYPTEQTAVGSHYRYLVEANCGLYLASTYRNLGLQACIEKVVAQISQGNDDDVWEYRRPTGGQSQPFRLVDFCGYNVNAQPFMWQSNPDTKRINYTNGVSFDCFIETYSDVETVEGVIERDDLKDTLYNSDSLYYVAVICTPQIMSSPSDSSHVVAYSICNYPISSENGVTASFYVTKNGDNYVFNGTSTQHYYNYTKYKILHILARYDGSSYTFLPMPFTSKFPPVTNLEIQTAAPDVQFDIDALANFVSYGSAIPSLSFQNINDDITINAWTGLTVRCALTNSGSESAKIYISNVCCETNCHNGEVRCTTMYDNSYSAISDFVTVPAKGSTSVYLTFAGVFDTDTLSGTDVEVAFWGANYTGDPVIGYQSWGNDGTIIYKK